MSRTILFFFFGLFIGIFGFLSYCSAAEPKIDFQALLAKRVPILFEFGSNCCTSCNFNKALLDDVAKAYNGRALVLPVDVATNRDLVRDFRIRMTPTHVFLSADGKEFFRKEGGLQQDQIRQVFARMGLVPSDDPNNSESQNAAANSGTPQ